MQDNDITDDRARTFVAALQAFEQDSDPTPLTDLFTPDAVTQRLDARPGRSGEVEQFWREYRAQFGEVSTTFSNVVEGGDRFALEWSSEATLAASDRPVEVRGVTALDFDGDKIVRLRTYYDSAVFVQVEATTA